MEEQEELKPARAGDVRSIKYFFFDPQKASSGYLRSLLNRKFYIGSNAVRLTLLEDGSPEINSLKTSNPGLRERIFDMLSHEPGSFASSGVRYFMSLPYKILAKLVFDRFTYDGEFHDELKALFKEAGMSIYEPTTRRPYIIADDTPFWKDRSRNDSRNPVEFIKENYGGLMRDGTWYHRNLTRSQLRRDPELYSAYATWIKRHPLEALEFAPGSHGGFARIDDPNEAINRRREAGVRSQQKARRKKGEGGPTP